MLETLRKTHKLPLKNGASETFALRFLGLDFTLFHSPPALCTKNSSGLGVVQHQLRRENQTGTGGPAQAVHPSYSDVPKMEESSHI